MKWVEVDNRLLVGWVANGTPTAIPREAGPGPSLEGAEKAVAPYYQATTDEDEAKFLKAWLIDARDNYERWGPVPDDG
jgi:hypothetical protein